MRNRLLFLAAGLWAWSIASVSSAKEDKNWTACLQEHAVKSEEKRAACYRQGARNPAQREAVLQQIAVDLEKHPDAAHLWRVLGQLHWNKNPSKADGALSKASDLFEAQGAWVLAARTRIQRLDGRRRREQHAAITKDLDALRRIASQTQDTQAAALADSAILDHQLRISATLDASAYKILDLSKQSLSAFPADIANEVLRSRIALAQHRLDLNQAASDIELLGALAEKTGDPGLKHGAEVQHAHNLYFRATLFPSQLNIKDAAQEAKHRCALDEKNKSITQGYFCRAFMELAGKDPTQAALVEELAKTCVARARGHNYQTGVAECHRLESRFFSDKDPKRAFEAAVAGLEALPDLNASSNARVSAWEEIMKSFWAHRRQREAQLISRAALMEIEFLRDARAEKGLRLGSLALWATTYRWLNHQIWKLPRTDKSESSRQTLFIQERSRARGLWDKLGPDKLKGFSRTETQAMRTALQSAVIRWSKDLDSELARQEVERLTQKLEDAAYPSSSFASLEQIQSLLGTDEAMISFQVGVKRSHSGGEVGGAWATVITKDQVKPVRLGGDRLRIDAAMQSFGRAIRDAKGDPARILQRLKTWIMDPLQAHLPEQIKTIVLIPDGSMYALPFTELAPQYAYSISPSATIWASLRAGQGAAIQPTSVVLADPQRSSSAQDKSSRWNTIEQPKNIAKSLSQAIPNSRKEVASIRNHLGGEVKSLVGADASEDKLLQALSEPRTLLHLSAHSLVGQLSGEADAIALATDGSGDFGLFQANEIAKLSLDNLVVVLGGCETGWGTAIAGEGMLSIARAFQEAGARSVLASLWPLRDDHTALFFDQFYAQLGQGERLDEALAQTQRSLRAQGYPMQSYAAFVVLGDASVSFTPKAPLSAQVPAEKKRWLYLIAAAIAIAGFLGWSRQIRKRSD